MIYDLAIIGGGTAGLTAALFAARHGMKTVVLERMMPGGQIVNAEHVENFPGQPQGLAGFDLGPMLQEQALNAGAEFSMVDVEALRLKDPYLVMETDEEMVTAKAVIVAGGSSLRKLGLPKEEELHGNGVSYCASCDGPFFSGQDVAVVGGGDSALDEALTLTEFATHVTVLCRSEGLEAQQVLKDRVLAHPKIEVRLNTEVTEIIGEAGLEGAALRDTVTGETTRLDLSGLFIFVGLDPNSGYLRDVLALDGGGHVEVDLSMRTPVPGVFAAGDIRQQSVAQLAASAGDGATAAISAFRYVSGRQWPS
ncbi:MAG: thioredoxin reductase (NADPH) [Chloroflexi bacterium]|jgi:thioredoxin reductase (NADPH)|nr:MAG: thioredoxin reductase (NADPH) [Chloroflexota bacterium]